MGTLYPHCKIIHIINPLIESHQSQPQQPQQQQPESNPYRLGLNVEDDISSSEPYVVVDTMGQKRGNDVSDDWRKIRAGFDIGPDYSVALGEVSVLRFM
jgi:hypothetical protein